MNKTANLYARIEPDVKEQAENVLETLGISVSSAINMFYKQIILQQGIPFDVKIPKAPENSAKWSKERLDAELEKGYNDMLKGRTRPAAKVLSDVKKKIQRIVKMQKGLDDARNGRVTPLDDKDAKLSEAISEINNGSQGADAEKFIRNLNF